MEFFVQAAVFVLIWGMLAASLNLCVGYTGVVSLAHAALFGLGAYASSLMSIRLETPFVVSLVTSLIAGAAGGAILATPLLRLKGDTLVIATVAFQGVCFCLINNADSLTGGPLGLAGIPRPSLVFLSGSSGIDSLLIVATVFVISIGFLRILIVSPFGRVLMSIRDDEKFAIAMGKSVTDCKVQVLAIGGAIAAAAGALYAQHVGFVDPSTFNLAESFSILCMVIVGGAGSFAGPLLGALFMVSVPGLLLFIGLSSAEAANWRQIIFGAALVMFMLWKPNGFLGDYKFRGDG